MAFERTRSKRKVPYIVENCVAFLIEKGLEVEGIFRSVNTLYTCLHFVKQKSQFNMLFMKFAKKP